MTQIKSSFLSILLGTLCFCSCTSSNPNSIEEMSLCDCYDLYLARAKSSNVNHFEKENETVLAHCSKIGKEFNNKSEKEKNQVLDELLNTCPSFVSLGNYVTEEDYKQAEETSEQVDKILNPESETSADSLENTLGIDEEFDPNDI